MSPASLMTLGPCSTPLFFCREENMGVVKLLKMIGSLKVMIILKKKNLNILLVLLKTERQARPPNELCFAGKYGWNDGKSGKDGKVLLSKPFSEIKSRPGHNETDSESDESSVRCCARGCWMCRWCRRGGLFDSSIYWIFMRLWLRQRIRRDLLLIQS